MAAHHLRIPYTKPAIAPAALLGHLMTRGLIVTDGIKALHALEYIGYYRLLIYMRALQHVDSAGTKVFNAGTDFNDILALYEFDGKLRLLCMEALLQVEVALRVAIVSQVGVRHGAHFYLDSVHFTRPQCCSDFQDAVRKEENRHPAIKHYKWRYSGPALPPIWIALEAVPFGTLSHLYSNLVLQLRKAIEVRFGYDEKVLRSWFRSLTVLRNIAAHHGRLWNAALTADKPIAPKRLHAVLDPANVDSFYARAVVITALLDTIDPDSTWKSRLIALLDASRHIDDARMGFPSGWRAMSFWK